LIASGAGQGRDDIRGLRVSIPGTSTGASSPVAGGHDKPLEPAVHRAWGTVPAAGIRRARWNRRRSAKMSDKIAVAV
jgi:hypothetical protein